MKEKTTAVENNIYKYLDLIAKQKKEIEEREMVKNSLTDSLVTEIRKLIVPYTGSMLREAWLKQNEKKKADRPMFEFMKNDLIERLFEGKKVKLDRIIMSGQGGDAYCFYFTCEKVCFEVKIPNLYTINSYNLENMSYGQYGLYFEEHPSVWVHIKYSYHLEDIAEAIDEFLNERRKENEN